MGIRVEHRAPAGAQVAAGLAGGFAEAYARAAQRAIAARGQSLAFESGKKAREAAAIEGERRRAHEVGERRLEREWRAGEAQAERGARSDLMAQRYDLAAQAREEDEDRRILAEYRNGDFDGALAPEIDGQLRRHERERVRIRTDDTLSEEQKDAAEDELDSRVLRLVKTAKRAPRHKKATMEDAVREQTWTDEEGRTWRMTPQGVDLVESRRELEMKENELAAKADERKAAAQAKLDLAEEKKREAEEKRREAAAEAKRKRLESRLEAAEKSRESLLDRRIARADQLMKQETDTADPRFESYDKALEQAEKELRSGLPDYEAIMSAPEALRRELEPPAEEPEAVPTLDPFEALRMELGVPSAPGGAPASGAAAPGDELQTLAQGIEEARDAGDVVREEDLRTAYGRAAAKAGEGAAPEPARLAPGLRVARRQAAALEKPPPLEDVSMAWWIDATRGDEGLRRVYHRLMGAGRDLDDPAVRGEIEKLTPRQLKLFGLVAETLGLNAEVLAYARTGR